MNFEIEGKECTFNRVRFKDAQDIEFAIKVTIDENSSFDDKKRADDIICNNCLKYLRIKLIKDGKASILEYMESSEFLEGVFENPYFMTIAKMKFLEYVMGFLKPLLNSPSRKSKQG